MAACTHRLRVLITPQCRALAKGLPDNGVSGRVTTSLLLALLSARSAGTLLVGSWMLDAAFNLERYELLLSDRCSYFNCQHGCHL